MTTELQHDNTTSTADSTLDNTQSAAHPVAGSTRLERAARLDERGNDSLKPNSANARLFAISTADGKETRFSEPHVVAAAAHPQINTGKDTLIDPSQTVRLAAPSQGGSPPSLVLIEALTVNRKDLAKLLRVSESTIKRLDSSDDIPGRCKILASVRYDRSEIERWVAEGCPPRADRAKVARARRVGKR